MFSGLQEILLIVLILLGIFLIPRMIKPAQAPPKIVPRRPVLRLSMNLRLMIVISILWPLAWAVYFEPWHQARIPFAVIGIGPVLVGWSLKWVLAGIKARR